MLNLKRIQCWVLYTYHLIKYFTKKHILWINFCNNVGFFSYFKIPQIEFKASFFRCRISMEKEKWNFSVFISYLRYQNVSWSLKSTRSHEGEETCKIITACFDLIHRSMRIICSIDFIHWTLPSKFFFLLFYRCNINNCKKREHNFNSMKILHYVNYIFTKIQFGWSYSKFKTEYCWWWYTTISTNNTRKARYVFLFI